MSTDRVIHPTDYPLPHPPVIAFARANGLDPDGVCADLPLTIEGGRLTVTEFVRVPDAGGVLRKVPVAEGEKYPKRLVTVPLISPPEAHGL